MLYSILCMYSFEGDLRVYFQCDGQDRVHLPDITIEVGVSTIWRLPAQCMTSSLNDARLDARQSMAGLFCSSGMKDQLQCRDILLHSQLRICC